MFTWWNELEARRNLTINGAKQGCRHAAPHSSNKLQEARGPVNSLKSAVSLQNENVRFVQSRKVRFHRWPRAL